MGACVSAVIGGSLPVFLDGLGSVFTPREGVCAPNFRHYIAALVPALCCHSGAGSTNQQAHLAFPFR